MKNSSTISSKGQITVPQQIRKRLGLAVGDRVEFVVEDGRTILRPVRSAENPFEKYCGILGTVQGGRKEIDAWIAELRDDESREADLQESELGVTDLQERRKDPGK